MADLEKAKKIGEAVEQYDRFDRGKKMSIPAAIRKAIRLFDIPAYRSLQRHIAMADKIGGEDG